MRIDLTRLEDQAAQLVAQARKAGADACDVVVVRGNSAGVEVRDGAVENVSRSESDDFSLRVFVGHRSASVNANTIANSAGLATRAVAMARISPEDPYQGLAPVDRLATDWQVPELFDETEPSTDELRDRALACEAAGIAIKGVDKSMGARAGWGANGFVLATSSGFAGSYSISRFSTSCAMVAGEGTTMERDYDFHSAVYSGDLRPPQEIGRTAGERVVKRINPRQLASMSAPVIFDRRIASGLLGSLLGAINGASVARKTSFLRDAMGKAVANAAITVNDDPLRRRGLGSRPFDGEGMPTAPICFVDNGVLQQWVLDWASARELDLNSNGRAQRGGSGTSPSTTNCHIEPGHLSLEEMMAETGSGLLVTETIGHGVNMVTGDFSKGASGFWFENGKIAYPVSGVTIAGNLKDMFLTMTPASDLEFRGATNAPSLRVGAMTIGGA